MAEATRRARDFADRYGKLYPKAVAGLSDDFASLTVHLRFPRQHWKRIRHSNFIERTFGESRRRVKVIGRLPGETSCLSLVWAVLDRASRGWRGCHPDIGDRPALQDLRRQLLEPPVDLGARRNTGAPARRRRQKPRPSAPELTPPGPTGVGEASGPSAPRGRPRRHDGSERGEGGPR